MTPPHETMIFRPSGRKGIGKLAASPNGNLQWRLIDTARAEPATVEKHGRRVVVVLSVEEYERLRAVAPSAAAPVRNVRRSADTRPRKKRSVDPHEA
jgi:prevent-host-death family protein